MKNKAALLIILFLIISCEQESFSTTTSYLKSDFLKTLTPEQLEQKKEIDELLNQSLVSGNLFDWNEQDAETLCNALNIGDKTITIGFSDENGHINTQLRDLLLTTIFEMEGIEKTDLLLKDEHLIYLDNTLGFMSVKVENCNTIEWLKANTKIEYLEALGFPSDINLDLVVALEEGVLASSENKPNEKLSDLCSTKNPTSGKEYLKNCTKGETIPYSNLDAVYEEKTWGAGLTISVIDTGTNPKQEEANKTRLFGSFDSSGHFRLLSPPIWFPDPIGAIFGYNDGVYTKWYDLFGSHGSEMIDVINSFSPRANVVSQRGAGAIVWIIPSHIYGITRALIAAADNPKVDIISMSQGTIIYSHTIARAIKYAYKKEKLIFSPAGTSINFSIFKDFIGVGFPANMKETIACTGVLPLENPKNEDQYKYGNEAHKGSSVDFTFVNNKSTTPTATMASITALIWSQNPKLTFIQVKNVLVKASSFYELQQKKSEDFGWGFVDVKKAIDLAKVTQGLGPNRVD